MVSTKFMAARLLIKGIVMKNGIRISCPVHVHNRTTGELLSKTISKSDGSYVLFGSTRSQNYVVATDPSNEYNLSRHDLV